MKTPTIRHAKTARQKVKQTARSSTGIPANAGLFANKPLVLHRTAASKTRIRPVNFYIPNAQMLATGALRPRRSQIEKNWQKALVYLRWRIFERIFRFFCPSFRRPLPDFFVPIDPDSPRISAFVGAQMSSNAR
jgi:hypothetical protein